MRTDFVWNLPLTRPKSGAANAKGSLAFAIIVLDLHFHIEIGIVIEQDADIQLEALVIYPLPQFDGV